MSNTTATATDFNARVDFCRDMIDEYIPGWTFVIDNAHRRLGQCRYLPREIGISRCVLQHADDHALMNTLTHEIAHAIVGRGHGHDSVWQRKHIGLGGDGERCSTAPEGAKPGRYEAKCLNADCPNDTLAWRWQLNAKWRNGAGRCKACRGNVEWIDHG